MLKSRPRRSFDKNPSNNFSYYKKYVYTVNEKVDTVKDKSDTAGENAVEGDKGNAVKSSAGCVVRPDQDVIDQISNLNSASMTWKQFDYIDA